jgi:tetratricopeptide (TPR) repeat protein
LSPAPHRSRARTLLAAAALVAAVAAAYAPVVECGFVWDDDRHVTANETLRSAAGLARIWLSLGATPQYYPMVHTSFWLEYRLWGLEPAGYHVVNVALHALCALLVWRVLLRYPLPPAAAFVAAGVFALHPVHVESVAWISERKNVLSAAFTLGSLLAYLHFLGSERAGPRPRRRLYALSCALYLGALASKTVACTLAPALLLLVWGRRRRILPRDVLPLLPFFAAGIAAGLLTVWMERHRVGAVGADWELSLAERLLVAGRALWFYAAKLVWPVDLSFIYPRWQIDAAVGWQWLYPASAAALLFALFTARDRIGTGPFVAIAFFAGTLVPALGFFDVYPMRFSFVADHFQYLASLGPIALGVALAERCARGLGPRGPALFAGAAALVLVLLGSLSHRRVAIYRDAESLWTATLERNPQAWIAYTNLGVIAEERGESERAIGLYRQAIRVEDRAEMAHSNLGSSLARAGRVEEGLAHLRRAVELEPRFTAAQLNLGNALAAQGRLDLAISHYRAATRADPRAAEAHRNLGIALLALGDLEGAIGALRRAVELRPGWRRAQRDLEGALRARDRGTPPAPGGPPGAQ